MAFVSKGVGLLREFAEQLGPYVMLEVLLPGGTLIALLLFLYRRRKAAGVSRWAV